MHQQLGVDPDLGHGRLGVVPQLPPGQNRIAGSDIRVGGGSLDVTATRAGDTLTTSVDARSSAALTVGAVLPAGTSASAVRLDGHAAAYSVVQTTRGSEVVVAAGRGGRTPSRSS